MWFTSRAYLEAITSTTRQISPKCVRPGTRGHGTGTSTSPSYVAREYGAYWFDDVWSWTIVHPCLKRRKMSVYCPPGFLPSDMVNSQRPRTTAEFGPSC